MFYLCLKTFFYSRIIRLYFLKIFIVLIFTFILIIHNDIIFVIRCNIAVKIYFAFSRAPYEMKCSKDEKSYSFYNGKISMRVNNYCPHSPWNGMCCALYFIFKLFLLTQLKCWNACEQIFILWGKVTRNSIYSKLSQVWYCK